MHNLDAEHCNVWTVQWKNGGQLHPCEKPTEILQRMIRTSSKPGDVVLDPFAGSGSTGVACVREGRDFIGIERDPEYFRIASERIRKAEEEQKLAHTE